MTKIERLIELAAEKKLQCLDFEVIDQPIEHDLLPLLRCAQKMAKVLRAQVRSQETAFIESVDKMAGIVNFTTGPVEIHSPATNVLKEWDDLNKEL